MLVALLCYLFSSSYFLRLRSASGLLSFFGVSIGQSYRGLVKEGKSSLILLSIDWYRSAESRHAWSVCISREKLQIGVSVCEFLLPAYIQLAGQQANMARQMWKPGTKGPGILERTGDESSDLIVNRNKNLPLTVQRQRLPIYANRAHILYRKSGVIGNCARYVSAWAFSRLSF
jgi:hypothetical protein